MTKHSKELLSELVVVLGMPRAGSTTLYHQLSQHPQVALPVRKEAHYFSVHYPQGEDWFRSLYGKVQPGQTAFDIGIGYFLDDRAIDRILRFNDRSRAILCIREPVSWVLSLYNQMASQDPSMPAFAEFLQGYPLDRGDQTEHLALTHGFVTRTLERCRKAFGDNILVYDFELFRSDPLRILRAIESFANLPAFFTEETFENVRLNASDRHHNVYLNAAISHERFLSVIHRVLPRRLLRLVREKYYLLAINQQPSDPRDLHDEENVLLAESLFGEERHRVKTFFSEHPIQLGSGLPFFEKSADLTAPDSILPLSAQ